MFIAKETPSFIQFKIGFSTWKERWFQTINFMKILVSQKEKKLAS